MIVGLDLSIVQTGWAAGDGTSIRGGAYRPPGPGYARHNSVRRWVNGMVQQVRPVLAVLEGYAIGKGSKTPVTLLDLGELGGVVRVELYRLGVPFAVVNPSTLKVYATNSGKAQKEDMVRAAVERLNYGAMTDDEADARWLCEMGLEHYGFVEGRGGPRSAACLRKVEWPKLG